MTALITPTNHIKRARLIHGLTQAQLAKLVGISQQQVAKLELSRAPLKSEIAISLAKALNVRLEDIVGVADRPRVPVIGKLSVNDLIVPRPHSEEIAYEDAPPFASPDMLAVEVAGDGAWPIYRQGDVVFVGGKTSPMDNIGEECVVELAGDGRWLLKRILRGSQPDRYCLASLSGPDLMEDQEVVMCRRVEFIRRSRRPQPH